MKKKRLGQSSSDFYEGTIFLDRANDLLFLVQKRVEYFWTKWSSEKQRGLTIKAEKDRMWVAEIILKDDGIHREEPGDKLSPLMTDHEFVLWTKGFRGGVRATSIGRRGIG